MNKIQTAMTAASNYFSYGYTVDLTLMRVEGVGEVASISVFHKATEDGEIKAYFRSCTIDKEQAKDIIAMSTHTKEQAEAFLKD